MLARVRSLAPAVGVFDIVFMKYNIIQLIITILLTI
nr:MAG TPA: hypothetical protein [Caudoviricetes sp.]